jgi:hypothetical protein
MDVLEDIQPEADEVDTFVPDFDPNDPQAWARVRKERGASPTEKTAVQEGGPKPGEVVVKVKDAGKLSSEAAKR